MKLQIYTDGGSKGNPGPAAIGIVCYSVNGSDTKEELFRYREDIGTATNNEAEYGAVVKALEIVAEKVSEGSLEAPESISFFSDSKLLVEQVNGNWKVKKGHIQEFVLKIRGLEVELGMPVTYTHIPREKNKLADALVNDVA